MNFHEPSLKPVLSYPEKYRFQFHEVADDKNNATTPLCLKGTEPSTLSDWQSWLQFEEEEITELSVKAPSVCFQAWNEGGAPMGSLQLSIELHRAWLVQCSELWGEWFTEKEQVVDFQFITGTISVWEAKHFGQVHEKLRGYPLELVNQEIVPAEEKQAPNMYMVPKRFDLFAFFEHTSFLSSSPDAFKKEKMRLEKGMSINHSFDLVGDDPAQPAQKAKKKARGGGAGASTGDGTQGTDAAKPPKAPKATPTVQDADSFLAERIEQIKVVTCSRKGCSKRIDQLVKRLDNGKDDSWFQPFWKHGCTNRHVIHMGVAILWHTGNMAACPDSVYDVGSNVLIPRLKTLGSNHFNELWQTVPEETRGWYRYHEEARRKEREQEEKGEDIQLDGGEDEEEEEEEEEEGPVMQKNTDASMGKRLGLIQSKPFLGHDARGARDVPREENATFRMDQLGEYLKPHLSAESLLISEKITSHIDELLKKALAVPTVAVPTTAVPTALELKEAVSAGLQAGFKPIKDEVIAENVRLTTQNAKILGLAFKVCDTAPALQGLVDDMMLSECLTPARALELGRNRIRTMRNRQEKDEATNNLTEFAAQHNLPPLTK